jgi:hypothetical protein
VHVVLRGKGVCRHLQSPGFHLRLEPARHYF